MISTDRLVQDEKDFQKMFDLYWEPLYTYAFKILEDHDDSQDIIQDLFLQLWKKKNDISITSSVEAYLFRSVKNRIYTHIRSNTRRNNHYNEMAKDVERVIEYEKHLEKKEARLFLQQGINRLPEKMQQIVKLYLHDSLNVKEIAMMLSLSEQTVRNQLRGAVRKLSKDLSGGSENLIYYAGVFLILSNC